LQSRVLVVDDEDSVRSALARSLTLLGYLADSAASGLEALEMLRLNPYDVMVLDMRMPGMDGVEVMQQACDLYPDLSIVILTGHATLDSAIAAVRSHAANYLLKPASVHDVAAAVASALQQRAVKLRRRHLLRVMRQALDEVRKIETTVETPPVPSQERFLCVGPVTLDRERRTVIVAGADDASSSNALLTVCETLLLAYMMQRPETPLSCRDLARRALGYDVEDNEAKSIIRPHICRLRRKMESDPSHPDLIRTIPGKGYLFAP
jgi:two-component system KDP operon response regulator KdpE